MRPPLSWVDRNPPNPRAFSSSSSCQLLSARSIHHLVNRSFSNELRSFDNRKKNVDEEACRSQGRTFLPLGFTLFGALSEGTTELLSRVADAAHQQGYVGEVWGTLKGDRVRAMHGLFRNLSSALNK